MVNDTYDRTSMMMACVLPRISKILEDNNCEFYYDGFIPSCKYTGTVTNFSIEKIISFMENDKYTALKKYIVGIAMATKNKNGK